MKSKLFSKRLAFLFACFFIFISIHRRALPDYKTMLLNFEMQNLIVGTQRHPSVIIIGAQKAGTRALIEFLRRHPSISAPVREQNYFSDDSLFDPDDVTFDKYRRCMPLSSDTQITLEKSPNYFSAEQAPIRIFQYQKFLGKKLQLILTVVPPINRAISHFYHNVKRRNVPPRMAAAFFARKSDYVRNGLYGKNLWAWLKFFSLDQILIVNGTALAKENPALVMQKIEDFLGLDRFLTSNKYIFHKDRGFYCYNDMIRGCLGKSKGHRNYSRPLSTEDFSLLEDIFTRDLQLFYNLTHFKIPTFL